MQRGADDLQARGRERAAYPGEHTHSASGVKLEKAGVEEDGQGLGGRGSGVRLAHGGGRDAGAVGEIENPGGRDAEAPNDGLEVATGDRDPVGVGQPPALLPGEEGLLPARIGLELVPAAAALPIVAVDNERHGAPETAAPPEEPVGEAAVGLGLETVDDVGLPGERAAGEPVGGEEVAEQGEARDGDRLKGHAILLPAAGRFGRGVVRRHQERHGVAAGRQLPRQGERAHPGGAARPEAKGADDRNPHGSPNPP